MIESKNFTASELTCSCCGKSGVQQWALDKLQQVRDSYLRPMTITSAYRCDEHPIEKAKSKGGTHNQGIAFDIYVGSGAERYELIMCAMLCGASGIGVENNFVHLDWRDSTPVMWGY